MMTIHRSSVRGPMKFVVVALLLVIAFVTYRYISSWRLPEPLQMYEKSGNKQDSIAISRSRDAGFKSRRKEFSFDVHSVPHFSKKQSVIINNIRGTIASTLITQPVTNNVEVVSAKKKCVLDEDKMYKDPNIPALYSVCEMTVDNTQFKQWLGKTQRLVHLDLKGAAPKPAYLVKLFPLMKEAGATGLLIEYEDMFPYSGELAPLASGDAYHATELKSILDAAKQSGLVVMPLVQTFGHLEFVLKHEKFMGYRELDDFPQAISPCVNGARQLLEEMLRQVITFHADSEYFHIGADEVYHLGQGRCKRKVESGEFTKDQLFLSHVRGMAEFVRKYGKVPVMWDDMYRHTPLDVLKSVSNLVEPMIWRYPPDVGKYITDELLAKYSKAFPNMWVASSFKGATGSNQYITNAFYHLKNHMAWLKVLSKHRHHINFRGIAMTGWQRFDHFATLCELLPQAVPSMVVCLQASKYGTIDKQLLENISKKLLKMTNTYELEVPEMPKLSEVSGEFPGSDVYKAVMQLRLVMYYMNLFEGNHMFQGWATKYHAKYNYFSPGQLKYAQSKIPSMLKNLTDIDKQMKVAMSSIFYHDTVDEWLTVNVEMVQDRLKYYNQFIASALSNGPKSWPARPFHDKNIAPRTDLMQQKKFINVPPQTDSKGTGDNMQPVHTKLMQNGGGGSMGSSQLENRGLNNPQVQKRDLNPPLDVVPNSGQAGPKSKVMVKDQDLAKGTIHSGQHQDVRTVQNKGFEKVSGQNPPIIHVVKGSGDSSFRKQKLTGQMIGHRPTENKHLTKVENQSPPAASGGKGTGDNVLKNQKLSAPKGIVSDQANVADNNLGRNRGQGQEQRGLINGNKQIPINSFSDGNTAKKSEKTPVQKVSLRDTNQALPRMVRKEV